MRVPAAIFVFACPSAIRRPSFVVCRSSLIPWDYAQHAANLIVVRDSRCQQGGHDSSDDSSGKKSPLAGAWQGLAALGYALAAPFTILPLAALVTTYPHSIARATIFW